MANLNLSTMNTSLVAQVENLKNSLSVITDALSKQAKNAEGLASTYQKVRNEAVLGSLNARIDYVKKLVDQNTQMINDIVSKLMWITDMTQLLVQNPNNGKVSWNDVLNKVGEVGIEIGKLMTNIKATISWFDQGVLEKINEVIQGKYPKISWMGIQGSEQMIQKNVIPNIEQFASNK